MIKLKCVSGIKPDFKLKDRYSSQDKYKLEVLKSKGNDKRHVFGR